MDNLNAARYGTTLFQCRARKFAPMLWIVIGVSLVLWFISEIDSHPIWLALAMALALALIGFGIQQLLNRPVIFEAMENGILLYSNADGLSGSRSIVKDLFVPWERIEAMRFIKWRERRPSKTGFAGGMWPVIALKIRTDDFWPAPGILRTDFLVKPTGEIYLDAFNGSLRGRQVA